MVNLYKELLQHIFLCELSKTEFFSHVAFHGGTCLRIIDKIDRFSEDLDFTLIKKETPSDKLVQILDSAVQNLTSKGINFEIKHNQINNNTQKIWLKESQIVKEFLSENPKYALQNGKIKIKIEIDIAPPSGSTYEPGPIDFPESYKIVIQDHRSSFSGKLHAVLCRAFFQNTTTYIKGRDFFDLDWYLSQKIQPNYELLKNALYLAGPYRGQDLKIDQSWLYNELHNKLDTLDWNSAQKDMLPFLLSMSAKDLEKMLNRESMLEKLKATLNS
ncbi:nucleotidyl transferase AbiEii/AbiGii toxin family protein [Bdellovibrionales bacterium]|nr:nucleotidyl transferase AbiEii/AbiGii toxin family protein [Bdellovibrionales bacterium]